MATNKRDGDDARRKRRANPSIPEPSGQFIICCAIVAAVLFAAIIGYDYSIGDPRLSAVPYATHVQKD